MSDVLGYGEMGEWVRERISPRRWRHTLGVVGMAERLAERWGVSTERARIAALLHDAARELRPAELLKEVVEFGIVRDTISDAEPVLYHGPVAAAWARRRWNIVEEDVLEAIAVHTTGKAGMSPLACVLYLADALEEGRQYPGVDRLRALAWEDLTAATRAALEHSIVYHIESGHLVHPDSLAARNDLVLRARGE